MDVWFVKVELTRLIVLINLYNALIRQLNN